MNYISIGNVFSFESSTFMRTIGFIFFIMVLTVELLGAQTENSHGSPQDVAASDTTNGSVAQNAPAVQATEEVPFRHSWGMDVLISTGGFGLGGFYRHEYTKTLSGFITLSISESKDEREIDYYDYVTQTTFVPGKKNRFLVIPLMVGVQQRIFSEDIRENFRPYVTAALGPTLIYATPYKYEFFSSIGHGHPYYTIGGYIGLGVFIGSDRSSLFGINVRYYFVPFASGIESLEAGPPKKDFGGFFITLTLGSSW
jgi:hypothetical protein